MGPRTFGQKEELIFLGREISEQRDYSEKTALQIDVEVTKLIEEAYEAARRALTENKEKLIHLATTLITQETLEGEVLEAVFKGQTPAAPLPAPAPTNIPAPIPLPASGSIPTSKPPPSTSPATNPLPSI